MHAYRLHKWSVVWAPGRQRTELPFLPYFIIPNLPSPALTSNVGQSLWPWPAWAPQWVRHAPTGRTPVLLRRAGLPLTLPSSIPTCRCRWLAPSKSGCPSGGPRSPPAHSGWSSGRRCCTGPAWGRGAHWPRMW